MPSTTVVMRILNEFDLTGEQKDELFRVMDERGLSLDERRSRFGEWLRKYVFSQPEKTEAA